MESNHHLTDILILLAAAVIAVPLFRRLGLGSVLGYLVAGAAVGPWGFGFIDEVEDIRHLAEFGVVFLLFVIGIELKPARLWELRRTVFGIGSSQVLLTGFAISGIGYLLGQTPTVSVIIGFGLALSSTAFGLQILNERGEIRAPHGRTAFSVLLLQDLAVVPLLTVVSLLAAEGDAADSSIQLAILKALAVIAFVVLAGRYLVTPALKVVATSRTAEVFTAAAVFAVLGTAWLMEQVGLSLALGAFLAGLMMAESQYRHQLIADIVPFRAILLGLFFMAVGMSIDLGLLAENWMLVAGLVLGLLALKSIVMWIVFRVAGVAAVDATRTALLLSQAGEFGFVIFGLAAITGLLPEDLFRLLILVVALTMITTPLMPIIGDFLARRFDGSTESLKLDRVHKGSDPVRVIIAGFGRVGRRVATILEEAGVSYLAIETDTDKVLQGRKENRPVYYGDASQMGLLEAAGAENADVLVCTVNATDPAIRLVSILRQNYPDIAIHARARDHAHCQELLDAGATVAVSETLEASLHVASEVLKSVGVPTSEANDRVEAFRDRMYKQ